MAAMLDLPKFVSHMPGGNEDENDGEGEEEENGEGEEDDDENGDDDGEGSARRRKRNKKPASSHRRKSQRHTRSAMGTPTPHDPDALLQEFLAPEHISKDSSSKLVMPSYYDKENMR